MTANIDNRDDNFWQHPYVDVFKYYNIGVDWKRTEKKGDVTEILVSPSALIPLGQGDRPQSILHQRPHFRQELH